MGGTVDKRKEAVVRAAMKWFRAHTHSAAGAYWERGVRPMRRMYLWNACRRLEELRKGSK